MGFTQVSLRKGFGQLLILHAECFLFGAQWELIEINQCNFHIFFILFSLYLSQRQEYSIAIIVPKLHGKMMLLQSSVFFLPEWNLIVVFSFLLKSNLQ